MKSVSLIIFLVLPRLICSLSCASEPNTNASPSTNLNYMIVVTGGELLDGVYPDGHTPFLTRTLRPLGGRCLGAILVDDRREDMLMALRFATQRTSLVIVTGGLGPTPNDITREVLSEFTGIPLEENSEALAELEKRFQQSRSELRPTLRRQTRTPKNGGFLKNPHGTAVGLIFQCEKSVIVALPGPPRELQPMVNQHLVPFLQRQYGARSLGSSLTLRFVGIGQSAIDQILKDRLSLPPDISITSLFEGSRVDFTFTLPGHTEADRARLQALKSEVVRYLGDYLYADDGSSLEEKVVQTLRRKVSSLVLAEIGSGGHLAVNINSVPGMDSFLKGAFLAPTESRMCHLLRMSQGDEFKRGSSPERVKMLAAAAVKESNSEWAVAVSAVEFDEQNTPFVHIAFGPSGNEWITRRLAFRDTGEVALTQLCTQILDCLRQHLDK